jgi:hypothetical protein
LPRRYNVIQHRKLEEVCDVCSAPWDFFFEPFVYARRLLCRKNDAGSDIGADVGEARGETAVRSRRASGDPAGEGMGRTGSSMMENRSITNHGNLLKTASEWSAIAGFRVQRLALASSACPLGRWRPQSRLPLLQVQLHGSQSQILLRCGITIPVD